MKTSLLLSFHRITLILIVCFIFYVLWDLKGKTGNVELCSYACFSELNFTVREELTAASLTCSVRRWDARPNAGLFLQSEFYNEDGRCRGWLVACSEQQEQAGGGAHR